MPDQVVFARPELLALLALLPPLVLLQGAALLARRRALRAFGGRGAALVSASPLRQALKAALAVAAVAALAVALAGPLIGVTERAVTQHGADVVVALDVSQSMAARDVAPDRLRAGRNVVDAIGKSLVGGRVGLVLFAGDAVVRYPLTTEPAVLGAALDGSGRGFRLTPGSSLRAGGDAALSLLEPLPPEVRRRRAIIVVTDGEDLSDALPDLAAARQRGITVHAVGVGTAAGAEIPVYDDDGKQVGVLRGPDRQPVVSRLREDRLRALAEQGGGRYWLYAGDETVAREIVRELRSMDTSEISKELLPADRFQSFLALALALLILEWLVSERARMPAPRPIAHRVRAEAAR